MVFGENAFKEFNFLNEKKEKHVVKDVVNENAIATYSGGILMSVSYSDGRTFYRNGGKFQTRLYTDVHTRSTPHYNANSV